MSQPRCSAACSPPPSSASLRSRCSMSSSSGCASACTHRHGGSRLVKRGRAGGRFRSSMRNQTRPDNSLRRLAEMEQAPRIVIVGGGIAGLELATKLGDRLGRAGKAQVTLVDRSLAHAWKPILHAFAAGTASPSQHRISFLDHARRHHFRFWPGEMCGLDRDARTVQLAPYLLPDGKAELPSYALGYDVLVITAGSRTNDRATPGVAEHCIYIDDLRDAELLNRRLVTELLCAIAGRRAMNLVVVGAGATGVELAAELSRSFYIAVAYDAEMVRSRLKVTLVAHDPRILPGLPDAIANLADLRLRRAGVGIVIGAAVTAIRERQVEL